MKKEQSTKEQRQEARRQTVIKGLRTGRKIIKDSAEGWGMLIKGSAEGYKELGKRVGGFMKKNIFMGMED